MIYDAHIHVGYFYRCGRAVPFYYSPRRMCTVLKKCGVDEFIYSSTSMQAHLIDYGDVNREMWEVQRIFGKKAHPFLWVTKRYLNCNSVDSELKFGFYEGVKLHGMDGSQWITRNVEALENVLSSAERYGRPVMIHTGCDENSLPTKYLPFILKHPGLRFNLAHGRPLEETEECMGASVNVFADVSCMDMDDVLKLAKHGWADRILWGTDLPALAAICDEPLTQTMREYVKYYRWLAERIDLVANFRRYLVGESPKENEQQ